MLIFPPISDPLCPYLSLPSLTAFLRQKGYDVIQKDVNIEAYHALLTKKKLQDFYKKISQKFKVLKNKRRFLPAERLQYLKFAEALLTAPDTIKNIERAKRVLRDTKVFYNLEQYRQSAKIFRNGLKLILGENYPYSQVFKVKSADQLMDVVYNEELNPFLRFLEKDTLPYILNKRPDIIGISIPFRSQMIPGFTLAHLIKEKMPGVHVTLGGNTISHLADRLKEHSELFSFIDSFVVNEGEHALLGLARNIENNTGLDKIPNLIFRNNGKFSISKYNFVEDINSLPTPDFDGLPMDLYFSPNLVIPLLSSKGCHWNKCAFCNMTKTIDKYYRPRDIKLVLEDIRYLSKRYKSRYFLFSDNVISPKKLRALSLALIKDKINIKWQCWARFEKDFTIGLCNLMNKAGCCNLSFGLESTSQRVLDLMGKGTDLKTIKTVLENCRKARINSELKFFIGFPTETLKEAQDTLHFILNNKEIIDSVSFGYPFKLLRGSKIFDSPKRYGINKIHKKNEINWDYDYEVKRGMSRKEVMDTVCIFQEKIDRSYPKYLAYRFPKCNTHNLLYASYFKEN